MESREVPASRPAYARRRPAAPPARASTSASISSCWKTRARLAPRAARIAISLRRPRARVKSRLPTFAQAMRRTSPTAASSIISVARTSRTISSRRGTTVAPQPALACGYACSRRFAMTSSSDRAWASSTPGRSRATACWLWFSRTARWSSLRPSGTQISREVGNQEAAVKSGGMTPMTV